MKGSLNRAIAFAALLGLSACGLAPPEIREAWDGPDGTRQLEYEIKRRVYCDLREGVQTANKIKFLQQSLPSGKLKQIQFIPDDWGAQVSLSLQVDEASTLAPGLTFTSVRPNDIARFTGAPAVSTGQSFALGAGATLSSTSTRIEKFDPYYSVKLLMKQATENSPCLDKNDPFISHGQTPSRSSLLLTSNLGIQKWIADAMFTNTFLPSDTPGKSSNTTTPDTITLELKFVVVTSGSITPTWKLVPVSANTGNSPLLGVGRTRTHDLIITLGPPKGETSQTHFASQIGQAIQGGSLNLR